LNKKIINNKLKKILFYFYFLLIYFFLIITQIDDKNENEIKFLGSEQVEKNEKSEINLDS
jgi:hypothetical protein